jgi:hypothetical protein
MSVGNERWFLLNCLNTLTQFDEGRSHVMRGMGGDIYMVLKLVVSCLSDKRPELFTLSQSNRMQLFATPSFKKRVEGLRLKGISFHRVGKLI